MLALLKKQDVNGDAKDKKAMLPVIQNVKEHVMESFDNDLQSPQSPPSGSAPPSPSQPKSGKQAKKIQVAPSEFHGRVRVL
jgi:hypothetical protein